MSNHIVTALSDFFQAAGDLLTGHLTLTGLLLVGLSAWARFDPKPAARSAQFAVLGVLVLLQLRLLGVLGDATVDRLQARDNAVYASVADQAGGETVQYAPSASYQERTSREQTLTFAQSALQVEGLTALPGWNGLDMEPVDHILAVRDRLEETPHATLVRRSIDFQRYLPLPLDDSLLALNLDFVPSSTAYQADFQASYSFRNPLQKPAVLRFRFPFPEDSGTLRDFQMTVNGRPSPPEWEGEVEAGGQVQVKVAYQHRGRRSWTYSPTSQREAIGHLKFGLNSDNSGIRFRRDSLFPNSSAGDTWTWDLDDVITSQDISLDFPATPKPELVRKTLTFAPLGLLLYLGALALVIGGKPRTLLQASLCYAGGVALASYLWTFLAFGWGLFWGGTVGCGLGLWCAGRGALGPAVLGWLTWLAFAWPGWTGLLLTGLGLGLVVGWSVQGEG